MSTVMGSLPEYQIVGVDQAAHGLARLTIRIPMFLSAGGSGNGSNQYPVPQAAPAIEGYGFTGAKGVQDSSGLWNWEITLEGVGPIGSGGGTDGGTSPDQTIYSFEPAEVDLPITSHPKYLSWVTPPSIYGAKKNGDDTYTFPAQLLGTGNAKPPSDNSTAASNANPLYGIDSYESFQGTYSISYTTRVLDPAIYSGVEQIMAAPPRLPFPIPLEEGRNWLKRMPKVSMRGSAISISERYLLSGRGGHNPVVYKTA